MKRAYITGATGAIGMALVRKLLDENVRVTVYLRRGSKRSGRMKAFDRELAAGQLDIVFLGLEEIREYLAGMGVPEDPAQASPENPGKDESVFYHLGWSGTFGTSRNDREAQQKNIEYTLDSLRLAARLGCGLFVGTGSQAEYGRAEGALTPDTKTAPESEYGKAKLEAGIESRRLAEKLNLRHLWVRILSVYGPYDGGETMIMSTIRRLSRGERAPLTQGIQTWDFLYSGDAAKALYLLGCKEKLHGKIYCLGSGTELPLREYILKLCRAMGADEALLDFGSVPYGPKQVMRLSADISGLEKDLGFAPGISFEEGIERTIKWCSQNAHGKEEMQF